MLPPRLLLSTCSFPPARINTPPRSCVNRYVKPLTYSLTYGASSVKPHSLIDWSRLKQVHGRVTPFAVLGQAHGERRWRLWLPISLGVPCTHAYQGAERQSRQRWCTGERAGLSSEAWWHYCLGPGFPERLVPMVSSEAMVALLPGGSRLVDARVPCPWWPSIPA